MNNSPEITLNCHPMSTEILRSLLPVAGGRHMRGYCVCIKCIYIYMYIYILYVYTYFRCQARLKCTLQLKIQLETGRLTCTSRDCQRQAGVYTLARWTPAHAHKNAGLECALRPDGAGRSCRDVCSRSMRACQHALHRVRVPPQSNGHCKQFHWPLAR